MPRPPVGRGLVPRYRKPANTSGLPRTAATLSSRSRIFLSGRFSLTTCSANATTACRARPCPPISEAGEHLRLAAHRGDLVVEIADLPERPLLAHDLLRECHDRL